MSDLLHHSRDPRFGTVDVILDASLKQLNLAAFSSSISKGGPRIAVYSGIDGSLLTSFYAFAQTSAPESLIKELYKIHNDDFKHETERIMDGKSRKMLNNFFDKTLSDYIWKDLTTRGNEVGLLDFDIFYAAQDAKITKLVVGQTKTNADNATVIVTFNNFGKKETLTYSLIKQKSAWKISNIKYADGSSLLTYFIDDKK